MKKRVVAVLLSLSMCMATAAEATAVSAAEFSAEIAVTEDNEEPVTDEEAVNAFEYLSKMEGIIPAIESAHAVAHAMKIAPKMDKDEIIMVCLSGRGDKDVASIAKYRGVELNE